MHPLIGLRLGGAHLTPRDHVAHTLAQPVWGPRALAADLALRLGIAPSREDAMARLATWYEAIRGDADAFFARSLVHDPWGTTRTVMTLHDALVDAGWDGAPIDDAGPRVATLTRLRGLPGAEADLLYAIETRLASARQAPYRAITLAEPITRWPLRWQRIVKRLDDMGARVDTLARPTPIAPAETDLGRVQRCLVDGARVDLQGDGTLVFLQAETCEPLAEAVAAWLRSQSGTLAILRTAAPGPLEAALAAHGLPRLGGLRASGPAAASAWLPLVLQLAGTQFDPEAAIDLLLLPDHELGPRERHAITRALSDTPGLGGKDLTAAMTRAAETAPGPTSNIERWLTPMKPPDLVELAARLRALDGALGRRLGVVTHAPRLESAAASDALALARAQLDAALRLLPGDAGASLAPALDSVMRSFSGHASARLTRFEAAALDAPELHRADHPEALVAACDQIVWWGFVERADPPSLPLRAAELTALAAHGIHVSSPATHILTHAEATREVMLRASERIVLAYPERIAAKRQPIHPLWSELRGRLGLATDASVARLMRTPATWLPPRERVPAMPLPPATATWSIGRALPLARVRDGRSSVSVTGLDELNACTLKAVLRAHARLRRKSAGTLAGGALVLGKVGHRLVEALWRERGLVVDISSGDVSDRIQRLLGEEAAHLLSPGRDFDRRHLTLTLREAVGVLVDELAQRGLTPIGSEEPGHVVVPELDGLTLTYQTDLRCHDAAGREVIVDLKWVARSHAESLHKRGAIQLAAYVHGRERHGASAPTGHYFGFADKVRWHSPTTLDVLSDTWRRVLVNMQAIGRRLAVGDIIVPPLADAAATLLDVEPADVLPRDTVRACRYCDLGAICGHAWRAQPTTPWRARR